MMESAQGEGRSSSMDAGGDGSVQLQGPDSAAGGVPDGGDWRARLHPETRKRVVSMLEGTLSSDLPKPELQRLSDEIKKDAVRIEEMLYVLARSETGYTWMAANAKLIPEQNPVVPDNGDYLEEEDTNYEDMLEEDNMEDNSDYLEKEDPNYEYVPERDNSKDTTPGLLQQDCNPGFISTMTPMSQRAASLPAMLGQGMLAFSRTSTLQDMSGVPRNTMNEGNSQDISAAQRQLILQQQKMVMQQHLQQHQKPPMQQHVQQQSMLHPMLVLSTQQPMMLQKFSGLLPEQCTVPYFPTEQPITVSQQQQQESIGQQSILQHGALQQESTLPIKLQSYPHGMSTMQPNNRNCSLDLLPRQKQEELNRMNEDMQRRQRQRLLLEMQHQLEAKMQSQKLQQAPMQVMHHHSENDVNEDKSLEVYLLLLSVGILVAMLLLVIYNHWWDLWQL